MSERPQDSTLPLLVQTLYLTLLEAFRKDVSVWNCFTKNENTAAVHKELLLLDDLELAAQLSRAVDDFCRESASPEKASEFYWTIVEKAIPKALECPASPIAFFGLVLNLLHLQENDEEDLRAFIRSMSSYLWSRNHHESPRLPIPDATMLGLLKLLQGALGILKSLQKPSEQGQLPVDLFERLLFPYTDGESDETSKYRPLISSEAREIVFDMVKMTCQSPESHRLITAATKRAMYVLSTGDVQFYPGTEDWLRTPWICSGLTNLGMTCYMNSLLQQLFANLHFRDFLLNVPVVHKGQQAMLTHLQHLFAGMQGSSKPCTDTIALARALNVQTDAQDDVHGFFATFFSRLEDNMPDNETKQKLSKFFTGKFITQIKGACGHVSTRMEPFIDISITVRNKASLHESLSEFVQGEPMKGANRYRCMTCSSEDNVGHLVNAMKRTCLEDVPDNLTFCLKRFTFEAMMGLEGKANDRFEFPAEIDMAVYKRSYLEQTDHPIVSDMFELVGVIVHQGSLEFGHYWSYIRIGGSMDSSKWFLAEDRIVKPVPGGIREVQDECFGGTINSNGNERAESAYVLLYQRASRFRERHQVTQRTPGDKRHAKALPPHVTLPAGLGKTITASNNWQYRVAHLFDPQFASFMTWLVESSTSCSDPTHEDSRGQDKQQESDHIRCSTAMESLATVTASYLLNVVMCDPGTSKRLVSISSPLTKALETNLTLTKSFLKALVSDHIAFHRIWQAESRDSRKLMGDLILSWLESLKSRDAISGQEAVRNVVAAHSELLFAAHFDFMYPHWAEYANFVSRLARSGPLETTLAHGAGYIEWAMSILLFDYQLADVRSRHRLIAKAIVNHAIDMSCFFGMLLGLLNDHVDLSEIADSSPAGSPREDSDARLRLLPNHWALILTEIRTKSRDYMALLLTACRYCSLPRHWKDYMPGLFLARLVEDRLNITVFRKLEMSLLVRLDEESENLDYLLYIVLNVCMVRDDRDMVAIMKVMAKTSLSWDNVEPEMLDFWYESIKLAPVATFEGMSSWALEYLIRPKKPKIRQRTAMFLREVLFDQPPLNADECDVLRIRVTRTLVGKVMSKLTQAYDQEVPRRHCEEMIQVLQYASDYLEALHKGVEDIIEAEDDQYKIDFLSPAINVECEESRSTLMEIKRQLNELSEWITEPANDVLTISLSKPKRSTASSARSEKDSKRSGVEEEDAQC
nr:isoform 3 of ubiquitin carboxyl-terminal hydrolase 34 [Quercus suber]